MTTIEAYHITRKFRTFFKTATPEVYKKIMLHKQTTLETNKVKYFIKVFKSNDVFFSKLISKHIYESFDIEKEPSANEFHHHEIKNIERPYYFTSIGLVDQETFFLAEDIMENLTFIKKKDLNIDSIYKSIQGKEYLFIGDLTINTNFPESDTYPNQLFCLTDGTFLNFSSIKLIEYIREQKDSVSLIRNDLLSDSKKLIFT